ncbi:MAG: M23 family metallopeptidase [Myxococcota bacterium]|nr:M23 family metallopeptidase [Myxococcota bacterium]
MPEPHSKAAPDASVRAPAASPSRRWVVLLLLVALGFVSGVGASQKRATETGEEVTMLAAVAIEEFPLYVDEPPATPEPAAAQIVVTKGQLKAGESLGSELREHGIPPAVVHLITRQIRPHFDFRRSRPGHRYRIALDGDGNLVDFRYSMSLEESIHLYPQGETHAVREERAQIERRVEILAGHIDSSLSHAVQSLGEDPQLADDFAQIFAWDIDFTRNVKSGDAFRILYERLYLTDDDGEDVYIRPGRILAARYQGAVGDHSVVYFEFDEGHGGYFRPDGTSIEGAFLLAPLRYSRVTSRYASARQHPILKVTRRHPGIDYAAAEGTQLWSVADGTVIYRGWAGASGNLVKVRHANGYVSHYAHLSRFADSLEVGGKVHQKEVIGYVGRTGLATGAHVCFRVTKNGRYVNPISIRSPVRKVIGPEEEAEFDVARDLLLAGLDFGAGAAADEAL